MKFKVTFNFLLLQIYVFQQKGERTKTTPDKTFQTKDQWQNPPDKNPDEQLRENLYRGLCPGFLLGLLKMGGPRCVTYFWGPGMCDKVWQRGGGSKLAKNSVTYFMDGPSYKLKLLTSCLLHINFISLLKDYFILTQPMDNVMIDMVLDVALRWVSIIPYHVSLRFYGTRWS